MEIAVHSEKETSEVNSSMLNSMAAHEYHSSAVASIHIAWQNLRSMAASIHAAWHQEHSRSMAAFNAVQQHSRSRAAFTQHGSIRVLWQPTRRMHDSIDVA
ncbi:hypothetical protein BDZ91DRAFT_853030 [Kalaharituber pfeilii]|nr:hypothetical protein BDZ91DRAFT_853030 [Kalaharituber pfeilii]